MAGKTPRLYLEHMREAVDLIEQYVTIRGAAGPGQDDDVHQGRLGGFERPGSRDLP